MQIKHLEYFVQVAEYGSINSAARQLFMSPQALSSAIAGLEREMGLKLFNRERKGVSLTAEGRRVLEDSKTILKIAGDWIDLGRREEEELSGEVTIWVSLALSSSFNRFLIELKKRYPRLSVIMKEGRSKHIVERMQKEPMSLALFSLVDGIYEEIEPMIRRNHWQVAELMEDEFAAVLGKDYFPEIKNRLSREDCAKMTLISSSDRNDIIGRRYFTIFGGSLSSQVESHSSILYMVGQNEGAIILPKRIAHCEPLYLAGLLRILQIEDMHLKTHHYLMYSKRQDTSPATQAVTELIKDYYTQASWEKEK